MFGFYYIPQTISNLNSLAFVETTFLPKLKKEIDILVIDDKAFSYIDSLRDREFRIKEKRDITDLNEVAEYDILLCDIRGVGKFLNSKFDGANLIKELKEKYPNKYIVAYSAEPYDATFEKYLDYADKIVEKGSLDLEDWTTLLGNAMRELADPVIQWKRKRSSLLDAGISTIEVAKYENKYVKAISSGNYKTFEQLCNEKDNNGGKLLLDLTLSVIAKLLKH